MKTERDKTLAGELYDPLVTRDVSGDVFAAGNPCRVIREVTG